MTARTVGREKRVGLSLEVEVKGRDQAGAYFREQTHSLNISGGGICVESSHHVLVGGRLELKIDVPPKLRHHFGGKAIYHVRAVVCRVERFENSPISRVGARFLEEVGA